MRAILEKSWSRVNTLALCSKATAAIRASIVAQPARATFVLAQHVSAGLTVEYNQKPLSGATPACRPPGWVSFRTAFPALTRWAKTNTALTGYALGML